MRAETVTVYFAFDGTRHETEAACRDHEEANFGLRFVGLTAIQVSEAFTRIDPELADAFETAGQRIGATRRAQGEYRRARNGERAVEPPIIEPADVGPEPADVGPEVTPLQLHDYFRREV